MKEIICQTKAGFSTAVFEIPALMVFNDHFCALHADFMGFLGDQYSQLCGISPTNHPTDYCHSSYPILFAFLPFGRISRTYLEKPDALFLLVREAEDRAFIKVKDSTFLSLVRSLTVTGILLLVSAFSGLGLACLGLWALLPPILVLKWFLFPG